MKLKKYGLIWIFLVFGGALMIIFGLIGSANPLKDIVMPENKIDVECTFEVLNPIGDPKIDNFVCTSTNSKTCIFSSELSNLFTATDNSGKLVASLDGIEQKGNWEAKEMILQTRDKITLSWNCLNKEVSKHLIANLYTSDGTNVFNLDREVVV